MVWMCFIAPPEVNFLCISAKLSHVFTKGNDGGWGSMCINFPLNQYLIISLLQWAYYPLETEIFLTDAAVCSTVTLPPSYKSRNPFHILFNIEYLQDVKYCIALLMLFHSRKNILVHLSMEKIQFSHFGPLFWIRGWHFSRAGENQHQIFLKLHGSADSAIQSQWINGNKLMVMNEWIGRKRSVFLWLHCPYLQVAGVLWNLS